MCFFSYMHQTLPSSHRMAQTLPKGAVACSSSCFAADGDDDGHATIIEAFLVNLGIAAAHAMVQPTQTISVISAAHIASHDSAAPNPPIGEAACKPPVSRLPEPCPCLPAVEDYAFQPHGGTHLSCHSIAALSPAIGAAMPPSFRGDRHLPTRNATIAGANGADLNSAAPLGVCLHPVSNDSTVCEPTVSSFQGCPSVITQSLMAHADADGDDDTIQTFLGNVFAAEDHAVVKSTQACATHLACTVVETTFAAPPSASHKATSHASESLHQLSPSAAMPSSHGHTGNMATNHLRHSAPNVNDVETIVPSTRPKHQLESALGGSLNTTHSALFFEGITPATCVSAYSTVAAPGASIMLSFVQVLGKVLNSFNTFLPKDVEAKDDVAIIEAFLTSPNTLCSTLIIHNQDDEDYSEKATHPSTEFIKGTQSFNDSSHASSNSFPIKYKAVSSTYITPPTSTFNKKSKLQATTLLSSRIHITFDPGGETSLGRPLLPIHSHILYQVDKLYNSLLSLCALSSTSNHTHDIGFMLSFRLRGRICGTQAHESTQAPDLMKNSKANVEWCLKIQLLMKSTNDPG